MLIRTHVLITLFAVLLFFPIVHYQAAFVLTALVATFLPDIDTAFSTLGKKPIFRVPQLFVKHRGFLHSFFFLFLITLFFVLFFPILAFGFFLGYALHLFSDSFTLEGIRPFYPLGKQTNGKIRTGGRIETSLFFILIFINLFVLVFYLF